MRNMESAFLENENALLNATYEKIKKFQKINKELKLENEI